MAQIRTVIISAWLLSTVMSAYGIDEHLSNNRNIYGRFLPRGIYIEGDHMLQVRQGPNSDPPTTTSPVCDQFDNYFYITPRNYTWQLQCTTNYEGTVIQQVETEGFAGCIVACADYNRANGAGACIGITFNGPDDTSTGLCTQFSTVTNLLLAYEEGNVQDSALLVRSPNGTVFATPRPGPSFSGQPSQAPTVVPLPSTSISGSTTIVFTTSVITVTSCPPGVNCPLFSAPSTTILSSAVVPSTSAPSVSVPLSSVSTPTSVAITDGGTRPGSPSSSITTIPTNTVGGQTTFTHVVTYTVYQVQAVALCPSTPGPCTQTFSTSTVTGLRTQLSCTPGTCTGILTVDAVANVAAATCIEQA